MRQTVKNQGYDGFGRKEKMHTNFFKKEDVSFAF